VKLTRLSLCLTLASVALQAQALRPRLVCLFLDLNSVDAAAQSQARDNAIHYVRDLLAPDDIVEIMTYTSRLDVIQDFTSDQDSLIAALRTILPSNAPTAANNAVAAGDDARRAQLQAIQTAVSSLSRFPERRAMVYFTAPLAPASLENNPELKDAVKAAAHASVAIYSFDQHGLGLPRK
jgi:VWFA-related protein